MTQGAVGAVAERIEVLEVLDRAAGREAHNLARWPELTWQQLYNRLQWEDGVIADVLAADAEARLTKKPWARLRRRFPESSALIRTLSGHDFWVLDVAISSTGELLATASMGEVIIWDLDSGEQRLRVPGQATCAIGFDGSSLVSVSSERKELVCVWDARSGAQLRSSMSNLDSDLFTSRPEMQSCDVSADGTFIVTGDDWGELHLWDPTTLSQIDPGSAEWGYSSQHRDQVNACAVSPDGSVIVTAHGNTTLSSGEVYAWDAASGRILYILEARKRGGFEANDCAISSDGRFVAVAGRGNLEARSPLVMWDLRTGEQLAQLGRPRSIGHSCAFSPDGSLVALGDEDAIRVFDVVRGQQQQELLGHAGPVLALAFSPDGSLLVSGSRDQTVKVWDVASSEGPGFLALKHDRTVTACAASPDGAFFISGGEEGLLATWDAQSGQRLALLPEPIGPEDDSGVGASGLADLADMMAEAIRRGTPQSPESTGGDYYVLHGYRYLGGSPDPGLKDCAVTPDASFVVSASGRLKLWDLVTRSELYVREDADACAVSPDGRLLIGCAGRTVKVWDAGTGAPIRTLEGLGQYRDCAVAPDSSFLVGVGSRGLMETWDLCTGELISSTFERSPANIPFGDGDITACRMTPDGNFVIMGSRRRIGGESNLALCDPDTGDVVVWMDGHDGDTTGCDASPDGRFVASAGSDHTLRLWRISDGKELLVIPTPGPPTALALHPWLPIVMWGDTSGETFTAELVGVGHGPIIVTAMERDGLRVIRCPKCWQVHPLDEAWLGEAIECPTSSCNLSLGVNPFIAGQRSIQISLDEDGFAAEH